MRPAVARVIGFSPLPAEVLVAALMQLPLTDQFGDWLNLKGVVGVEHQQGAWQTVGQQRLLRMSDGSVTRERLVGFDPVSGWSNVLFGFTNTSRRIVTEIHDDWRFARNGSGTSVTWSWTFHPQPTVFGRVMSHAMAAPLHRVYLRRILQSNLRDVEARHEAPRRADGAPASDGRSLHLDP